MRDKPLILLVDDEANFLEIISTKLGAFGYEVVVAHSGKEAVDIAKKIQPDLVLMDIAMPGQTGTDAALTIKQDSSMKDLKIAFLSNMKDPWPRMVTPREELAKELGMEEFIDKAADLDVIAARVKAILGK
jgi:CheY-like chemotaxis protein